MGIPLRALKEFGVRKITLPLAITRNQLPRRRIEKVKVTISLNGKIKC